MPLQLSILHTAAPPLARLCLECDLGTAFSPQALQQDLYKRHRRTDWYFSMISGSGMEKKYTFFIYPHSTSTNENVETGSVGNRHLLLVDLAASQSYQTVVRVEEHGWEVCKYLVSVSLGTVLFEEIRPAAVLQETTALYLIWMSMIITFPSAPLHIHWWLTNRSLPVNIVSPYSQLHVCSHKPARNYASAKAEYEKKSQYLFNGQQEAFYWCLSNTSSHIRKSMLTLPYGL